MTNTDTASRPLSDRELARQKGFTMEGVKHPDRSKNFSRTTPRGGNRKTRTLR